MKVCPNPETLALYAGEELDASERTRVATHIIECSTCGALIANLQSDRELLQAHPDIPEDAIQEVHRRVMSQLPAAGSLRRYLWPAAIAACVALLALTSTLVRRGQPAAQPIVSSERRSASPALTELSPELNDPEPAVPACVEDPAASCEVVGRRAYSCIRPTLRDRTAGRGTHGQRSRHHDVD